MASFPAAGYALSGFDMAAHKTQEAEVTTPKRSHFDT
jgi:hypothetical protein